MNSPLHSSERPSLPQPVAGELLSALVDGQLAPDGLDSLITAFDKDESLKAQWSMYHLIGETLRSPGLPVRSTATSSAFATRLSQRLAAEQITIDLGMQPSPRPVIAAIPAPAAKPATVVHHRGAAANDGTFRWKLAAGFASLAAVSAIAWNASGSIGGPADAPQLAMARSGNAQPIVVASPQGPMVRDARLEELLAAHRQLGGSSALEAPSGFLRNAAFEPAPGAGGR